MTTTINASTTAGLVQTADTSGVLALQTAGTTAVTVDASQNVGIGTASPASKLNIVDASATVNVQLESGSVVGQYFASTSAGGVYVGSSSAHPLVFRTNTTERMRVNAGAPILCLSGGSTTATGTGIAFPATQSASSDVNTLDDYEEGTWTPVLVPTSGSITTQTNSGAYTKIGGQVTVNFLCIINNVGTATALSSMSGLPFASSSAAGVGAGRESSSTGLMWQWLAGSGLTALSGWTYANNSAIATGYSLRGTLTYFV